MLFIGMMAESKPHGGAGVVLAPLYAGTIGGLANLVNFTSNRAVYILVWAVAHLAALAFGYWSARKWRPSERVGVYVVLALFAGVVEAILVFGVLSGLTAGRDENVGTLATGFEDYVAVVATALFFAAGAAYGLRTVRTQGTSRVDRSSVDILKLTSTTLGLIFTALQIFGFVNK